MSKFWGSSWAQGSDSDDSENEGAVEVDKEVGAVKKKYLDVESSGEEEERVVAWFG